MKLRKNAVVFGTIPVVKVCGGGAGLQEIVTPVEAF